MAYEITVALVVRVDTDDETFAENEVHRAVEDAIGGDAQLVSMITEDVREA